MRQRHKERPGKKGGDIISEVPPELREMDRVELLPTAMRYPRKKPLISNHSKLGLICFLGPRA